MTSWTLHDPMFHDLRGHCSFPSTIILGFALLAWLVLLSGRLFHIGFDERWRRRFLFFHLFDPSQSDTKPFLRLFQCLTQFLVLFSQLGRFFFCHDPSLSERSSLNSYPHEVSELMQAGWSRPIQQVVETSLNLAVMPVNSESRS